MGSPSDLKYIFYMTLGSRVTDRDQSLSVGFAFRIKAKTCSDYHIKRFSIANTVVISNFQTIDLRHFGVPKVKKPFDIIVFGKKVY